MPQFPPLYESNLPLWLPFCPVRQYLQSCLFLLPSTAHAGPNRRPTQSVILARHTPTLTQLSKDSRTSMPSSKRTTSSVVAQMGSTNSATSSRNSYHPPPKTSKNLQPIEWYVAEARDHRSYSVADYDRHQEAARLKRQKQLSEVVEMDYGYFKTADSRN